MPLYPDDRNSPTSLRPMTRADIQAVAELALATPLWQRHGVTASAFAARLKHGLDASATIWVAVSKTPTTEPRLAGFIWFVVRGAFRRSGYVMQLGVAQTFQGRGVGRQLMAHAEEALFAHSDDVFLLVSDFNVDAQRFYLALGYAQVGILADYVTPGIDELIYRKRKDELVACGIDA